VAFGGAGPVHAYGLCKKLGAPRLLVPPNAGVGSALGFFTAPRAFDLLRSHKVSLGAADFNEIEKIFKELEAEATRILKKEATEKDIKIERSLDMRFVGQGSETNVPLAERDFTTMKKGNVRRRFDEVYEKLYGRTYPDSEVEFINFKLRASLPERLIRFPKLGKQGKSLDRAIKGKRKAYSARARDFIPYTVYDRYNLFPKARFKGPAIIEEKESTVIVGEDASVSVDDFGFLWIEISKTPESAPLRRGQKSRSVPTRAKPKISARGKSKR
jgi:N-methylhydantoinase A/oxoprolinase/acetone carboxylase beta subunit